MRYFRHSVVVILVVGLVAIAVIPMTGCGGTSASSSGPDVTPTPHPVISLSATPTSILKGQTSVLSWKSENADTISITPGVGTFTRSSGTAEVSPTATTTYTATATGDGGTANATATVEVATPGILGVSLTASPSSITTGGTATLTWSSQNATSVRIDPAIGPVALNGSVDVTPAATTTYVATATGTDATTATASALVTVLPSGSLSQINHVIWILQEFRSFDNYFGKLDDYRQAQGLAPDVDGLPPDASNPSVDGKTRIPAFHLNSVCIEQMTPAWDTSRRDISRYNPDLHAGPMDGFVYSAARFALDENTAGRGPYSDVEGIRAMGYYTEREIPYYYFMATQFATSDRFFGTILSRTPPNRIANLAASALGVVNSVPKGTTFQQKTIFHLLQSAGISWKIYQTEGSYLGYFQPFYGTYRDHVVPSEQFFIDLQNNTLPQVAYLEPTNVANEHTAANVQLGVARIADIINALMASESWKDSIFFLTYDHGGEYDHVPPQPAVLPDNIAPRLAPGNRVDDYSRTGFRVPLIVVSPFAKKGYVSHTVMDNTAILKFIETRFGLPNLSSRDAAQADMTEFLDLVNVPNATPPTPPVQPTDAPCTFHKLP